MKNLYVNPSGPLKGEVSPPGDKSISHRSAMLGSIAQGETRVSNFLMSADCLGTVDCFKKLGINAQFEDGILAVEGKGLRGLSSPKETLDVGNSGTTIRLMMGILAGQNFRSAVTGDESIRRRPMGRVVEPLKKMGANIKGRQHDTLAPLTISGGNLNAIRYAPPVASAQVKSAVLLAGLYAAGVTEVAEKASTRDHTERMLEYFGAGIKKQGLSVFVEGGKELEAKEISVPGDISSAAFILAAAAIVPGSDVVLRNVGFNPGRTGIIDVLRRMGADIEVFSEKVISNEPVADIRIKASDLKGIELKGDIIPRVIDEIPVIAVLATQAAGKTVIKGAEELRIKESDRIAGMTKALKSMGAKILDIPDGFVIEGKTSLKGARCMSFKDHRIAMSAAVAGLAASGETVIDNPDCIEISFPCFAEAFSSLSSSGAIEIR